MQDSAPRVLVVDDEPKICELLETLLRKEGYLVDTALDGSAAIGKLGGSDYNLVLSDIKMPGMDGFELARRIKEMHEDLPLVVITGYATMETAVQALRQGVDDYVTKPFKLDEIRSVISRVLAKTKLTLENRRLVSELEATNEELRRHRQTLKDEVKVAGEDLKSANLALRQRVQELEMLNEIGTCAASELDRDELLEACARLVGDKLQVTRASIVLREGEWLTVKACYGPEAAKLVGIRKRIGEGVAGEVVRSAKPVLVKDIVTDSRFSRHADWGYVTNSLAGVPIIYKRKTLGAICATDKRSGEAFTESDVHLLGTIASQVAPAIENTRLYKELQESTLATVRSLVAGLETKDAYLSGHSRRVTLYALEIGKVMNVDEDDMLVIERASQLHDLGKIGVPEQILSKPASLTPDEYEVVKRHPILSEQIIRPLEFLKKVRPPIRHHHERPDGKGYPDGQGRDEMCRLTKIIGVADAFDAMTSARPYRRAKGTDEACSEISSLRGKQFDPDAADVFCDHVVPLRLPELKRYGRAG